jgi:hypothetical protein
MAGRRTSPSTEVNVATLEPNAGLTRLRADLQRDGALRKELAENPAAVFEKYNLTINLASGTLSRLRGGGGFDFPGDAGVHADAHADAHVDVDPHIDFVKHIDLF